MTARRHLLLKEEDGRIHLSHFMHLVSAYASNATTVGDLAELLEKAMGEAKANGRAVVVDQDAHDFFFLVYPSGTIGLCARMRSYVLVTDEAS